MKKLILLQPLPLACLDPPLSFVGPGFGFPVELADRLRALGGLVAVKLGDRPLDRAWRRLGSFGRPASGSHEQQQWKSGSDDIHEGDMGTPCAMPRARSAELEASCASAEDANQARFMGRA